MTQIRHFFLAAILLSISMTFVNCSGHHEYGEIDKVKQLSYDNFNKTVLSNDDIWMVVFHDPECHHCKGLEPIWTQLAVDFKGKIKFGAVDGIYYDALMSMFKLHNYPVISVFTRRNKKKGLLPTKYEGDRTLDLLTKYCQAIMTSSLPSLPVNQLIEPKQMKGVCMKTLLCFIGFVPGENLCDSTCFASYLNTMKLLSRQFKNRNWGFMWSFIGDQANFERTVGVLPGKFNFIAMSTRRLMYSYFAGNFSNGVEVQDFIRLLENGEIKINKLAKLPKIVKIKEYLIVDTVGEGIQESEVDDADVEQLPIVVEGEKTLVEIAQEKKKKEEKEKEKNKDVKSKKEL